MPLERRAGNIRFQRPEIREVMMGGKIFLEGEVGEIKNFMQPRNVDRNYLGLLFHRAAESGVFEQTFRKVWYAGQWRPVIPRYFGIETHRVARRHFNDLGFADMPEFNEPSKPFAYYMKIDLGGIYQVAEKHERPSALKKPLVPLNPGGFELIDWDPVSFINPYTSSDLYSIGCDRSLIGKIPFYKEL
jgi:hypothetical protein